MLDWTSQFEQSCYSWKPKVKPVAYSKIDSLQVQVSQKICKVLKITSSHRGKPKEPLGWWSDACPPSLMVASPSQIILNRALSFPHLLVILNTDLSWFWRIMLFVLTIVSGTLCSSWSICLIVSLDLIISPNSCLLIDSSTRAISTLNMQRTGLWSLSVTSMQASYLISVNTLEDEN